MCRSRRELSNEYLLAKIGVDTAANEPLEVWGKICSILFIRVLKHRPAIPARPTGEFDPHLETEAWRVEMGRCLQGSLAEQQLPMHESDRIVAELQQGLEADPDFVEQHALCQDTLRTYVEASAEYREAKRQRVEDDHDYLVNDDDEIAEDSQFECESDDEESVE